MKKALFLAVLAVFLAVPSFAQVSKVLTGTIIDMDNFNAHQADLPVFIKGYTKDVALRAVYAGYALFTDNKVFKFDVQSNVKIEAFLKKKNSKLNVVVNVQSFGNDLTLVSIENQK